MSGPPDALDLSLNEVEQLALKAARGAGLPWGVAEDTGRAAAWIAAHIGPWAASLLALLETPPPSDESPLWLAGLLADSAGPVRHGRVVAPSWALPGLFLTTRRMVAIRLEDADVDLRCNPPGDVGATASAQSLSQVAPSAVTLEFPSGRMPALPHPIARKFRRSLVAGDEWRRLSAFAYRTYVPATDLSRRSGAGAGLLDDD